MCKPQSSREVVTLKPQQIRWFGLLYVQIDGQESGGMLQPKERAQERQGERAWFLYQKPLLCNKLAYAAPVKAKKQQPWVACLEPSDTDKQAESLMWDMHWVGKCLPENAKH